MNLGGIGNKPKEDVPNKMEPHGLSQDRIKDLVYFHEYIPEEHYKYISSNYLIV